MHTAMRYLWHMRTASISDELNDRVSEVRATVAANLDAALKAQRWSRRAAAVALGLSHRAGDRDHGTMHPIVAIGGAR